MDTRSLDQSWIRQAGTTDMNGMNGNNGGRENHWNMEDGDFLSYFLSGEQNDNCHPSLQLNTATGLKHGNNNTTSSQRLVQSDREFTHQSDSKKTRVEHPSTPALQFYTGSSISKKTDCATPTSSTLPSNSLTFDLKNQVLQHQNQQIPVQHGFSPSYIQIASSCTNNKSSSSSSSSLSTLPTVSGHVTQVHPKYFTTTPKPQKLSENSLSPTTMFTQGEEVMMLPPPPKHSATIPAVEIHPTQKSQHWVGLNQGVVPVAQLSSTHCITPVSQTQPLKPAPQIQTPSISSHSPKGAAVNTDILPSIADNARQLQYNLSSGNESKKDHNMESKEKRDRRLARNRESARQSRRRKKQLLFDLGGHVHRLHMEIESVRQKKLMVMDRELDRDKKGAIRELFSMEKLLESDEKENLCKERIKIIIRDGGANSAPRRLAATFQYDTLRQLILPYYKQYLLWLSLKTDSFFTVAKEKRSKTGKGTGRVGSKHVGDELTTAHKCAAKINNKGTTKTNIACGVDDSSRVWPLICYELGVSLDQEEKLLNAFQRVKKDADVPKNRRKISIATIMVSNLKNGILCQSRSVSKRNEKALLEILTPAQAARFLQWFIANKERCSKLFGIKLGIDLAGEAGVKRSANFASEDTSLNHQSLSSVCQKLTEALKISRKE